MIVLSTEWTRTDRVPGRWCGNKKGTRGNVTSE